MNIQPKSPELIQSQIATFAAEKIDHDEAKQHVFKNIGNLAVDTVTTVNYVAERDEYLRDENGEYIRQEDGLAKIPKGTERTAATRDEYIHYLRSVNSSHHEAIAMRANLLERYREFKPEITHLMSELEESESRKDHPAHLGSGSNVSAFRLNHDGKEYAVRAGEGALGIDGRAEVTARAKGIPHLEQVVAMSYDSSIIVTEIMPGQELGKGSSFEDMQQVTDAQLSGFVETITAAVARGIDIDPKPSNIFYDTEGGFGLIDLNPANQLTELGNTVGNMATSISSAGFFGNSLRDKTTPETHAQDLEWHKLHLNILTRYRDAVVNKLDGSALQAALKMIDRNIESARQSIDWLSEPENITIEVARAKESVERKHTGSWTSV